MINVLIFPGGSEIGLEINNSLKYSKLVKVFGRTSANDHSDYVYPDLISDIPDIIESDFIEVLNSLIEKYTIACIYPALDMVQTYLTEHEPASYTGNPQSA